MTSLWHPFADMGAVRCEEFIVDRAEDIWVWDEEGRRYLDATAGLWYSNVGHGRAEIIDAVADQLSRLDAYPVFGDFANRPALDLAGRLCAFAPGEGWKAFLGSGGSDGIDTAIKLSRRYFHAVGEPRRHRIVTRESSYHGAHGWGTAIAGIPANREGFGPLVGESMVVGRNSLEELEEAFLAAPGEIAAVLAEPVMGAGGLYPPAPGYLQGVQRGSGGRLDPVRGAEVLDMDPATLQGFRRTDVAMIFQEPRAAINPVRTVGDYLREGLRNGRGLGRKEATAEAVRLLDAVGIDRSAHRLRQYPHEISGGMLQRVMIAGALGSGAKLILADEPTTALDVSIQAEVVALLDQLRREHDLALLFITHDLDLAVAICDRIDVMYAGSVLESRPSGAGPPCPTRVGCHQGASTRRVAQLEDRRRPGATAAPPVPGRLRGRCPGACHREPRVPRMGGATVDRRGRRGALPAGDGRSRDRHGRAARAGPQRPLGPQ